MGKGRVFLYKFIQVKVDSESLISSYSFYIIAETDKLFHCIATDINCLAVDAPNCHTKTDNYSLTE